MSILVVLTYIGIEIFGLKFSEVRDVKFQMALGASSVLVLLTLPQVPRKGVCQGCFSRHDLIVKT